jgi:hypothetical protein
MVRRVCVILLLLATVLSTYGEDKVSNDSTWNNWHFRVSPYFWYIGFQGTIYRPPQPSNLPEPPPPEYEIDVGFKDIKNSIKFIAMLAGRYRGKKIVTQFNFTMLILESEAITPFELILQDIVLRLNYFSGDLGVGYRIIRTNKFELDGLIGLKFIYFKIGGRSKVLGRIPLEGERDHIWLDPVFGTNIAYRPHKKIELRGYADIGGGILGSKLSYQVIAASTFHVSRVFHISLGYRLWGVEHELGEAIFNGHVEGWFMHFGFQF